MVVAHRFFQAGRRLHGRRVVANRYHRDARKSLNHHGAQPQVVAPPGVAARGLGRYPAPPLPATREDPCTTSVPATAALGPNASLSTRCCSPGWRVTAGSIVPAAWPRFDAAQIRALAGRSYAEIAVAVTTPFIGERGRRGGAAAARRGRLCRLRPCGGGAAEAARRRISGCSSCSTARRWPSRTTRCSSSGRLFDHVLAQRGERVTIVGATSGDTGSAAIEACRDRDAVDIFILYPEGPHLRGAAPADDDGRGGQCPRHRHRGHLRRLPGPGEGDVRRRAVPRRDSACRRSTRSTGRASWPRSSITSPPRWRWARRTARSASPCRPAISAMSSPRYVARRMGLPIAELIVGTNRNDILARFIDQRHDDHRHGVEPSLSPSMDIQVVQQFRAPAVRAERARRRRGARRHRARSAQTGTLPTDRRRNGSSARQLFAGASRRRRRRRARPSPRPGARTGELLDPHSAVGAGGGARGAAATPTSPMVALRLRPSGEIPRCGREARPACARRCRRASPIS